MFGYIGLYLTAKRSGKRFCAVLPFKGLTVGQWESSLMARGPVQMETFGVYTPRIRKLGACLPREAMSLHYCYMSLWHFMILYVGLISFSKYAHLQNWSKIQSFAGNGSLPGGNWAHWMMNGKWIKLIGNPDTWNYVLCSHGPFSWRRFLAKCVLHPKDSRRFAIDSLSTKIFTRNLFKAHDDLCWERKPIATFADPNCKWFLFVGIMPLNAMEKMQI